MSDLLFFFIIPSFCLAGIIAVFFLLCRAYFCQRRNRVQNCSRPKGHTGPSNGWECDDHI